MVERGLPGGARALLPRGSYAALGSMVAHRPRPAGICSAGGSGPSFLSILAYTSLARCGISRGAGLLRVSARPHSGTRPRAPGAGPLPVTAARGRPGEGCVEFDWYVLCAIAN